MTAPRLRQVYDQVHFPLMVPHKIARYSELSSQSGVRGFKPLKNQHEVALTFEVGQTSEYWQVEESTWKTAPILQQPVLHVHPQAARSTRSTRPAARSSRIALITPQASVLGLEHDPATSSRTRRCSRSPRASGRCVAEQPITLGPWRGSQSSGPATSASSPARALRISATRSSCATSCPSGSRRCRRARFRSTSPGSTRCSSAAATGSRSRSTCAEAVAGADFLYVAVGTPPTYSGDADLSAVWTVVDEIPGRRRGPPARS